MRHALTLALFTLSLVLGAIANAAYSEIRNRVQSARFASNAFESPLEMIRILKSYKQHTRTENWPIWPLRLFYAVMAVLFLLVFVIGGRLPSRV
jgi:hypothetical protein